jgi:hypothetical protein
MTIVGFSKNPLIHRFHKMHPDLPIWFLYGSNSWIKEIEGKRAKSLRPETSKTYIKV